MENSKLFIDKNGKEIVHHAEVIVPDPNESDIHIHSFHGTVVDILPYGNCIVEDGDSDFFEIECERLEVVLE